MGKYNAAPTVAAGLLRLARHKAGLTQAELAALAGVTQQAVSAYETGRKEPTLPTIERLVDATGHEIRFHIEPKDDHDESLAEALSKLNRTQRAALEQRQVERLRRTELERVRGR